MKFALLSIYKMWIAYITISRSVITSFNNPKVFVFTVLLYAVKPMLLNNWRFKERQAFYHVKLILEKKCRNLNVYFKTVQKSG